jgi:hypothetical protein
MLNLFFGLCRGTHGLPTGLRDLGYIPEAVETPFNNSDNRPVVPDLIIASAQIHHTVVLEWKSGANTEADQLQRYSRVVPADLIAKAYVHVSKCATHDVTIIGKDEHRDTLPIGISDGRYTFPVVVVTPTGMEIILNAFTNQRTGDLFRHLVFNWATLPMSFFPLDADSELWEFAEVAIPIVLEEMASGSNRISREDLGKKMFKGMWDRMHPDYRGLLKTKIQQVMDQASHGQFSRHLERNTTARGTTQSPIWDVLDNPLNGAADKRQRAWRTMRKKQEALIEYFQNPHRQEFLGLEGGESVR